MKLIIGNKNYSSWSLRPWLLLSAFDIPFEEVRVPLYIASTRAELAKYTDAGKVPVLHDKDIVVWDSLAICEYVSEQYLNGRGWPSDTAARAEARACCAEMHSGFFALRESMPMNCRASGRRVAMTPDLEKDIARIDGLWTELRKKYSAAGPWLFGAFSIADCMFAPVAFRFNTYRTEMPEACGRYVKQILQHPKVTQWLVDAVKEPETIASSEVGV
ncbi:MAG TPA: glutathione S-transferase family protein [Gammaproteobacteria bacterium]